VPVVNFEWFLMKWLAHLGCSERADAATALSKVPTSCYGPLKSVQKSYNQPLKTCSLRRWISEFLVPNHIENELVLIFTFFKHYLCVSIYAKKCTVV
jgi:hypothetical protein